MTQQAAAARAPESLDPNARRCPACGARRRTKRDHDMLHAICRTAAAMWPHGHRFQPQGLTAEKRGEHLRGWLTVEARHVQTATYHVKTDAEADRVLEVLRPLRELIAGSTNYVRVVRSGDVLTVVAPGSMAREALPPKDYDVLRTRMYDIIEAETGMTIASLKRNTHTHDE